MFCIVSLQVQDFECVTRADRLWATHTVSHGVLWVSQGASMFQEEARALMRGV